MSIPGIRDKDDYVQGSSRRKDLYIQPETVEIADLSSPATANDARPYMLCKWGEPILYFRTMPGSRAIDGIDEIYDYIEVGKTLSAIEAETVPSGRDHSTDALIESDGTDTGPIDGITYANGYAKFYSSIRNEDVTFGVTPHNVDTFILWSAGKDGEYGTDDDVTNFDY
jgi:hypothetical protein